MRRALRQFGRLGWIRPTVLLLLICHLGRFYSDAPTALAICFEHNHRGVTLTAAEEHHAHHLEAAEVSRHTHGEETGNGDTGFKVEHCRDVYQGLNLVSSSTLSLPVEGVLIAPAGIVSGVPLGELVMPAEPSTSIFHPPQLLS